MSRMMRRLSNQTSPEIKIDLAPEPRVTVSW